VRFLSEGPAALGNDYAIDDISFNEIDLPSFAPVKSVSAPTVCVGSTVTYTITISNTCTQPITALLLVDNPPAGLVFVPGSVIVDGISRPNENPAQGIQLSNLTSGESTTVNFTVEATNVPADNPAINIAQLTYDYTPIEGGIPETFTVMSNPVPVTISACNCEEGSCTQEFCRMFDVSVPITVTPFATPDMADVTCEGELTVVPGLVPCESDIRVFDYTVTQRIRVDLPINFGAEICLGETCTEDEGECTEVAE
jgi:uncharacterized repeat protein (TIGR01451 family)